MVDFLSSFTTPTTASSPEVSAIPSFELSENCIKFDSPQLAPEEYGYVFVILGDLTKLNCDYWLGPTGAGLDPSLQKDFPRNVQSVEFVDDLQGKTWKQSGFMGPLRTYEPWPPHLPQPFSIGLHSKRGETESYIREIVRFIRAAAYDYYFLKPQAAAMNGNNGNRNNKSRNSMKDGGKPLRRSPDAAPAADDLASGVPTRLVMDNKVRKYTCPLIAVPLLGTGSGGNYLNTGKMTKSLLPVLYQLCNELFVDVVVITIEEDVYKLIQACRHTIFTELEKTQVNDRANSNKAPTVGSGGRSIGGAASSSSRPPWFPFSGSVTARSELEELAEGVAGVELANDAIRADGSIIDSSFHADENNCGGESEAAPDGASNSSGGGDNDNSTGDLTERNTTVNSGAGGDPFGARYADWRFRPFKSLARRGAPRGAIEYAMEKDGCSEDEISAFLNTVNRRRAKPTGNAASTGSMGSGSALAYSTEGAVSSMSLHDTITGLRFLSREVIYKKIPFLVAKAAHGELSLFLGAGASMGAGLPSWGSLLDSIAKEVGVDGALLEEFNELDYYTKAAVLEHRINKQNAASSASPVGSGNSLTGGSSSRKSLSEMVAEKTTSSRYSVVHALLAAMPVSEIITTNYDDLLERCLVLSGPFAVLPAHPHHGCKKWLLKMHGCVTRPHEIVFTKRDYIRYGERFAALGGIVQSMLLTKHLLFVGFSLDDDNFTRIFDSVRKAVGEGVAENSDSSEAVAERSFASIINPAARKRMKSKYKSWNNLSSAAADWSGTNTRVSGAGSGTGGGAASAEHLNFKGCGTALLLEHSVWKEEMWQDQIGMVFLQNNGGTGHGASPSTNSSSLSSSSSSSSSSSASPTPKPPPLNPPMSKAEELARLARKQEILLDILSASCSRCAASSSLKFLMNDVYEDALSAGELEMKQFYKKLMLEMKDLSEDAKNSGPYMQLESLVKELRPRGSGYYVSPPSSR